MKLATYELNGKEKWGFVVSDPLKGEDCIINPQEFEEIKGLLFRPTNFFGMVKPEFIGKGNEWPGELVQFLEMGNDGMEKLRKMESFVKMFIERQDVFMLSSIMHPVSSVRMKAPIPRPRLYWGLVQNCPSFFRENPKRQFVNLFCQGHQRTQAACTGYNGKMIFYNGNKSFPAAFTCEMGVVIGKYGKSIPAEKALDYVCGYTNVIDATCNPVKADYGDRMGSDWYIDATGDWIGKLNDTMGAMGPYITTKDEISNPYDLLSESRQNGRYRDRGFSGELILGIERTIEFYSSFAALHPGDVIHLGSMQADGMLLTREMSYGKDDSVEVEIEKLGAMRVQFLNPEDNDWRSDDDVTLIHRSDAVRDLIVSGNSELHSVSDFDSEEVRHFWTAFANYQSAESDEGLIRVEDIPRMLNNPGRAVSSHGNGALSQRCKSVKVGIELCAVVKKLACNVSEEAAEDYILGYSPLVSINDQSFNDLVVREHSTPQERIVPSIYARWGDGYNVILDKPVKLSEADIGDLPMTLTVDGVGSAEANTSDYIVKPAKMLSRLSKYLTLFPGDVISLGRTRFLVNIPEEIVHNGFAGTATIDGIGKIDFSFK